MNSSEFKELETLCRLLGINSLGELANLKSKYGVQSNGEILSLLESLAADINS